MNHKLNSLLSVLTQRWQEHEIRLGKVPQRYAIRIWLKECSL